MIVTSLFGVMISMMISLASVGGSSPSPTPASTARDPKTIATMQEFLHHIVALVPMMSSPENIKDKKSRQQAREHIRALSKLSKEIPHSKELHQAGRWVSARALQNHLVELNRVFDQSGSRYAFRMLTATLDACASCHSQMPTKSLSWDVEGLLPSNMKTLDKIEFLFATRHWDQAHQLIDHALLAYPKPSMKLSTLDRLVELKLVYFLRVNRDIAGALSSFQSLFKNKSLPDSLRRRLSDQIFLLKTLEKVKAPDPSRDSAKSVEAFASSLLQTAQEEILHDLSDVHRATFLYVSGILYEFLNSRKTDDLSPGLYYWLSVCDDALNNQFFFGLADLYLKECVERFPSSKMARTCFASFEERKHAEFTGTAGEDMPPDARLEIQELKKKLK